MHTLTARPLTLDDFEHNEYSEIALSYVIGIINGWMEEYKDLLAQGKNDEAKEVWCAIIQLLPESYLQLRGVQMSYAALRNIIHQRKGHKLGEWKTFIDWCHTLPEEWMLFDD